MKVDAANVANRARILLIARTHPVAYAFAMPPDDPRRLLLLLAALAFVLGSVCGGAIVYAAFRRSVAAERARAIELVRQLRAACAEVRGNLAVKAREIRERAEH